MRGAFAILMAACGFDRGAPASDDASGTASDGEVVDASIAADAPPMPTAIGSVATLQVAYMASGAITYTVAGNTSLLLVSLSTSYAGTTAVAVQLGATLLTRVGFVNAPASDGRVEIWRLIDPPAGASTIAVTLSDTNSEVIVGAMSFTNTHATAPLGTLTGVTGTMGPPTVSVPSATGELVLAVVMWNGSYAALNASATQASHWSIVGATINGAGSTRAGAAMTTLRWDVVDDFDDFWAIGALPVKPR